MTRPSGRDVRSENPTSARPGLLCHVDSRVPRRPASFFGRTAVVQVPELTAVDIDHLHDLALAGALAQVMEPPQDIDVDAVITDFDGVHTDDSVAVAQDGRESVRVSRPTGLALSGCEQLGYRC
jgi:hypothetical protein